MQTDTGPFPADSNRSMIWDGAGFAELINELGFSSVLEKSITSKQLDPELAAILHQPTYQFVADLRHGVLHSYLHRGINARK